MTKKCEVCNEAHDNTHNLCNDCAVWADGNLEEETLTVAAARYNERCN